MQFKSIISNIVYAVVLFVVIFVVIYIDLQFSEKMRIGSDVMPRIIFISFSYPIIGAIIGLPSLWKQFEEKGLWRVNIPRLLILALPAFVLANFVLFAISLREILEPILLKYSTLLSMSDTATYIFQILFGFILITSFYKEKERVESKVVRSKSLGDDKG